MHELFSKSATVSSRSEPQYICTQSCPQCDVIVGQGHGCGATGDDEIKSQAAMAHSYQRLYFTQRGPRQVLSSPVEPSSRLSPFMFSTHIRSDDYSHVALRQIARTARRSLKLAVLNFAHNAFFDGVAVEAVAYATDSDHGYTVVHSANVKATVCQPLGATTGAAGCLPLSTHLDAVVASSPDVLLVSSNDDAFKHVLRYLSDQRPNVDRGEVKKDTTALSALFWVGVPWLKDGVPACAGLRSHCAYAIGATQISPEEADMYADQLLLSAGAPATYGWLRENHTDLAAAYVENVTKAEADAAVIPSIIAQAMQHVFRYSAPTSRQFPLRVAGSADYEALRAHLASGEVVARTYYGPISFDSFGNNAGRQASVFQAQADGLATTTFPATLTGSRPHHYPVPAVEMARKGAAAFSLDYGTSCDSTQEVLPPCGATEGEGRSCLLCKPLQYDEQFPVKWGPLVAIAGPALLLLFLLCFMFGRHKVRQADENTRRAKKEAEEKDDQRVREAIDGAFKLQHSAALLPAARFVTLGRLVQFEELRDSGALTYLDSIEELLVLEQKMIFISHQWTGNLQPDQQYTVEVPCQMREQPSASSKTVERGEVQKDEEIIVCGEVGSFLQLRKKLDRAVVGWVSKTDGNGATVLLEHHKQYDAMVNGVRQICRRRKWALDQVLIWVDYSSIPQANDSEKEGAIRALPAYASCTNALLIAAPKVRHTHGDYECNLNTYRQRM